MKNTAADRTTERLFVAVRLPRAQRELLEKEAAAVSGELKFAKWTHSEDYHITLQFLGDTPRANIPELLDSLKGISGNLAPFSLYLDDWGTFGPASAPRVLWAGISGELGKLKELQQSVVAATAPLGFIAETRAYHPHITLARKYRDEHPYTSSKLQALRAAGDKKRERMFVKGVDGRGICGVCY